MGVAPDNCIRRLECLLAWNQVSPVYVQSSPVRPPLYWRFHLRVSGMRFLYVDWKLEHSVYVVKRLKNLCICREETEDSYRLKTDLDTE